MKKYEGNIEDFDEEVENASFDTPEQLLEHEIDFDDQDDDYEDAPATNFEDITESLSDIDFSEMRGDFRSSIKHLNKKLDKKGKGSKIIRKKGIKKPSTQMRQGFVRQQVPVGKKPITQVLVPRNRKVIVEGVSKFILSDTPSAQRTKNIGYYNGKKLNELVFTINNQSALDFDIEFFNPSFPLDYLFNTSQNVNSKILVAGLSPTSYTDVLFNILANPTMIVNAKFLVAGPSVQQQINQSLIFANKNIEGKEKLNPYNLFLQKDGMQFQNDIIFFDIMGDLARPFIPDGMDIIKYKVLPQMSVTFGFYYKQVSLKKFFYSEARQFKGLL